MSDGRPRVARILAIGIPILGGMGSSALLSLVDTAMVGWLGSAELAAVGLGSFASWIYLGFFQGLTIAVQALVSRRVGQGRIGEAGASLNAALLLLVAVAPTSAAILWVATPSLFALLNDDPAVLAAGVPYLRWVIAQSLFMGAIYAFNGFWNGIRLPFGIKDLDRIWLPSLEPYLIGRQREFMGVLSVQPWSTWPRISSGDFSGSTIPARCNTFK